MVSIRYHCIVESNVEFMSLSCIYGLREIISVVSPSIVMLNRSLPLMQDKVGLTREKWAPVYFQCAQLFREPRSSFPILSTFSPLKSHDGSPQVCTRYWVLIPSPQSSTVLSLILYRCGQGGIGEALVMEYKRLSMHAIATVLPHESSVHLSQAGITCFPLDVTVENSVSELRLKVEEITGGHLHILVNCAYASVPPQSHR